MELIIRKRFMSKQKKGKQTQIHHYRGNQKLQRNNQLQKYHDGNLAFLFNVKTSAINTKTIKAALFIRLKAFALRDKQTTRKDNTSQKMYTDFLFWKLTQEEYIMLTKKAINVMP